MEEGNGDTAPKAASGFTARLGWTKEVARSG